MSNIDTSTVLPTKRTKPAAWAAAARTEYRAEMAGGMREAPDEWVGAIVVFVACVLGVGAILGSTAGLAVGLAAGGMVLLGLPALVTGYGLWTRRVTVLVPRLVTESVENARTAIRVLAEHDPAAADRLYAELVGYIEPASRAVELAGRDYRWLAQPLPTQPSERVFGLRDKRRAREEHAKEVAHWENLAATRAAQLAANPVGQVIARIDHVTTTAHAAAAVAVQKDRFADAPRRELEAQIAAEREAERLRELNLAYETAMAHATATSMFASADIAADAEAGQVVLARLTA